MLTSCQFEYKEVEIESCDDEHTSDDLKQNIQAVVQDRNLLILDVDLQSAIIQIKKENGYGVFVVENEENTTRGHGHCTSNGGTEKVKDNIPILCKADAGDVTKGRGDSVYNLRKEPKKKFHINEDYYLYKEPTAEVVIENLENGSTHLWKKDTNSNNLSEENKENKEMKIKMSNKKILKNIEDKEMKIKMSNKKVLKNMEDKETIGNNLEVSKMFTKMSNGNENFSISVDSDKSFKRVDIFLSNMQTDKNTCSICGKKFVHRRSLLRHTRKTHVKEPIVENIYDKEYTSEANLQTQTKRMDSKNSEYTHLQSDLYICTKCGRGFKQLCQLKRHEPIHTGEKPHLCTTCGKQFTDLSTFNTHVRLHTGYKPYVCNVCDKHFSDRSMFHRHKLIHTGERPYLCMTCGKSFRLSSSLNRHERIHTGYKPYTCKVCDKKFADLGTLKKHMLTHKGKMYINDLNTSNSTSAKVYKCDTCEKVFNDCSTLRVHKRLHTGEKPYKCSTCGKRFTVSGNLNKHQMRHI